MGAQQPEDRKLIETPARRLFVLTSGKDFRYNPHAELPAKAGDAREQLADENRQIIGDNWGFTCARRKILRSAADVAVATNDI